MSRKRSTGKEAAEEETEEENKLQTTKDGDADAADAADAADETRQMDGTSEAQ